MADLPPSAKTYVQQGGSCFSCGKPWIYDDFVGIYYCGECDVILAKLPRARSYMILGDTGAGKSVLLNKILDLHLKNKSPCVYVGFDEDPVSLREFMGKYVSNLEAHERNGLMTFFDCYSCTAGIQSGEKYFVTHPGDLNDLNIQLTGLVEQLAAIGPPVVCMDSLSTVSIHCESDLMLKFVATFAAKLKLRRGSLFHTLTTGTVPSEVQKKLEQLADGLIELRIDQVDGRTSRQFRISKIRGVLYYENWLPFFLGKSSIFLSVPTDEKELQRFDTIFKMISER